MRFRIKYWRESYTTSSKIRLKASDFKLAQVNVQLIGLNAFGWFVMRNKCGRNNGNKTN